MIDSIHSGWDERPEPWEQQPDESARAYHAFCHYRDLPAWRRGLRQAAEDHRVDCLGLERTGPKRGTARSVFNRWKGWSVRHRWVERVRTWDREQDRQRREANRQAIEDMRRRHAELAVTMLDLVAKRLEAFDPDDLTPKLMIDWFKNATSLERIALGIATEAIAVHSEDRDDNRGLDLLDASPTVRRAHDALLAAIADDAEAGAA